MGFEVKLSYYEKVNDDYDKENIKEISKKIGSFAEDVSLEKLAAFIMMQMARRDIFVVSADIFEFKKTKISFKEAKGGIILKNKKFLFDGGGEDSSTIVVQDLMSQAPVPQYTAQEYVPPQQVNNNVNFQGATQVYKNLQPHEQGLPRRPVDYVVFSPELLQMPEVKQKNLRFTPDKKYGVFEKRPAPGGMGEIYVMLDDTGREQLVSDEYFVPGNIQLFAGELGFTEGPDQRDGGKLYWGSAKQEPDMPDIRR